MKKGCAYDSAADTDNFVDSMVLHHGIADWWEGYYPHCLPHRRFRRLHGYGISCVVTMAYTGHYVQGEHSQGFSGGAELLVFLWLLIFRIR